MSDGIVPHFNERGEGDTALVFLHGVGGGKEIGCRLGSAAVAVE